MGYVLIDDTIITRAKADFDGIQAAIIRKGGAVPAGTPTSQYRAKIEAIQSAAPLRLNVVCSLTAPKNPVENMIWVYTSMQPTVVKAAMSQALAEVATPGDITILCGKGNIELRNNSSALCPIYVLQYIDPTDRWVGRPAVIRRNGRWEIFFETTGLIAHLPLNTGAATVEAGSASVAENTQTAWVQDATAGKVLDPSGGTSGHLTLTDKTFVGATIMTLIACVKTTSAATVGKNIFYSTANTNTVNMYVVPSSNTLTAKSGGTSVSQASLGINNGAWHAVGATFPNTATKGILFLDGANIVQSTTANTVPSASHLWYIGGGTGATGVFPGRITQVLLYNRHLLVRQVNAMQGALLNRVKGVW